MSDQTIRIENWEVVTNRWNMKKCLHGEVEGHPRFPNGSLVTTSMLMELRDKVAVTKSGTIYQLGRRRTQDFNTTIPHPSMGWLLETER
jgi:hypothetical protein